MEGLKPYAAYKDSGLPWLGQVPAHWETCPGFAAFREKQIKNVGMQEKRVLSLSYGRIVVKPEGQRGLMPDSFETYQIVDPGDIIIRSTDLQNDKTSLRIGYVRDRGIITSAYICMKATDAVLPEFGYQLLNAYDLSKVLYGMGSGLRQNLEWADFKRMPVFLPPREEQTAIVRFLDHATHQLDKAIRAKRKIIALLNEQKQAIIHRTVTRGLDPDVPLKDSGIPWLGQIPAHWDVVLNQRIFKENIRPHQGIPEVQLSLSQRAGLIATANMKERSLQTASYDNWKVVMPGDLVLNRFKAHLGVFFAATLRGIVSFHYGVFSPRRDVVSKYYELLYHTNPYKAIYAGRSNGMTIGLQNLSNQSFYGVRSPVPPRSEQLEIIVYAEQATAEPNRVIAMTQREIDLLREYRTRLIADVVTGKLDVREAAAHLPEIAPDAVEELPSVEADETIEELTEEAA